MIAAFYKSTHEGWPGVYNRLVRWWTRSKHSHVELIFSNGISASSSYMDGGVRFKSIVYDPTKWDFIEVKKDESEAYAWFKAHEGDKYDVLGNVTFVLGFVAEDSKKESCAESVAKALGYKDAWRFNPAILAAALAYEGKAL